MKEVFDKRTLLRGVGSLKRKISALPKGATIFWLDRVPSGTGPKAKGSESLAYPPSGTVKAIQDYAAERGIKVEILPSQKSGEN